MYRRIEVREMENLVPHNKYRWEWGLPRIGGGFKQIGANSTALATTT